MDLRIDVSSRGPVFDGRARRLAAAYVNHVERDLAKEGVRILRQELRVVLQHPTGYYESNIQVERGTVITDGGVVYGPWLAGTGSRNFPVTRFRGYPHWIRATLRLRDRKRGIAERLLRRYVGRM
jgi:hypothetical protein